MSDASKRLWQIHLSAIALIIICGYALAQDDAPIEGQPLSFWIGKLKSTNAGKRFNALCVLCTTSTPIDAALPTLVTALTEERVDILPSAIISALGKIKHKDSLNAIMNDLQNDKYEKYSGIEALGKLGSFAKEAIPLLESLQPISDDSVNTRIALTLWQISGKAEPTIKILLAKTGHKDINVRIRAIEFLGEMKGDAKPAIGRLEQLLNDPKGDIRRAARRALSKLAQESVKP